MKHLCNIIAGLLVATAAPGTASAADWWWVAGEPGSDEVWFVDADTIMSAGGETSFSQLHLKRGGAPQTASQARLRCSEAANDRDDAIRRFVCATPEERISLGAMLGPISPEVSARIIFDTPPQPKVQGMAATN
jgi:hypothetical protein